MGFLWSITDLLWGFFGPELAGHEIERDSWLNEILPNDGPILQFGSGTTWWNGYGPMSELNYAYFWTKSKEFIIFSNNYGPLFLDYINAPILNILFGTCEETVHRSNAFNRL